MSYALRLRDCKEWKDQGLIISTTSNEAAKLFDAALTQYVSWREIDSLGGLDQTLENLKKADPCFGLGHILSNALRLIGTSTPPSRDPTFRDDLNLTYDICSKSTMNKREKLHLKALKCLDDGFMGKACEVWQEILQSYPTDMLALKLAHDCYFYLGDKVNMKDSLEGVFDAWKDSLPLYNFLFGMKAFALCENKDYVSSEIAARKGLELDPCDAWSTHALAHDFEMTGRFVEGEKFLESTVLDWEVCNLLSCHVHWHNALYSIERGDYEKALGIFDEKVGTAALNSGAMLDLVDACSLLYRLQMEGQPVKGRFEQLFEMCMSHKDDHVLIFNDLHFLMTYLGSGKRSEAETFVRSLREEAGKLGDPVKDYSVINSKLGIPISNAMLEFDGGKYDEAVKLLKPVEDEVVGIGGSDAQRDVFDQLLLKAAICSQDIDHQEIAESLIKKRKGQKATSPLTDRLAAKFLSARRSREI